MAYYDQIETVMVKVVCKCGNEIDTDVEIGIRIDAPETPSASIEVIKAES